ncbi:MAG: hypothetical protein RL033_3017 [Pseudomonadota bacterium]|jgi:hypothetical protein
MASRSLSHVFAVVAVGLLASCASQSSAPPPAPPKVEKAPEPAPPPPVEQAKPERSVSEVLSVPDKAWVFSFEGSAAYDKAKAGCEERFKDDPGGRARCVTKARDTFTADAMEFTRDDAGNDVWVIYRTKSNKLIKVYSVQIEYGAQEGDTLSIKKLGRESGKPLLFSGVSEFKVKLGGEYSLEMEDAKHGVVAYDARLGFISGQ